MKKLSLIFLTIFLFSCKKETIVYYYTNNPIVGNNNTPTNLPSNLILNLDATNSRSNQNNMFWYDLSGNNFTARLENGATFVNGSVSFDGVNDVVTLGRIGGYSTQLTVEAWVRTTNTDRTARSIITSNNSGDFVLYTIGDNMFRYTNFGTFYNIPFQSSCFGNIDISRNGWTHYVVTYNNNDKRVMIYTDGINNMTYIRSGILDPGNLSIGNLSSRLDEGWKGEISIVRMYNKVLTPNEISTNYNNEKSKFGK